MWTLRFERVEADVSLIMAAIAKKNCKRGKNVTHSGVGDYCCGAASGAVFGSEEAGVSMSLPFSEIDFSKDCLVSLL